MKYQILLVFLLVASLLFIPACVSTSSYKALQDDNMQLLDKCKNLELQADNIQKELELIENERLKLTEENKTISGQLKEANINITLSEEKIKDIQTDFQALESTYESLNKE